MKTDDKKPIVLGFGKISLNIRNKLLLTFLPVVIAPLVIVGWYSMRSTSNALEEIALKAAREKGFIQAKKIEKALNDAKTDIYFLSQSPTLKTLVDLLDHGDEAEVTFWKKKLEQEFLIFSQNRRLYYQITLLDTQGQELARVDSYGDFSWIAASDQLRTVKDEFYFNEVLKYSGSEIFISDLSLKSEAGLDEVNPQPVIKFAISLFNSQYQKKGILFTSLIAHQLLSIVQEESPGLGIETFLINKEGFYLSHPDRSKEWGGPALQQVIKRVHRDYPSEIVAQLLSGKEGTITQTKDAIISYIPIFPKGMEREDFWVLVDVQLKNVVFASVANYKRIFLTVVVMALLGAFLLSLFLSRRLTAPLMALRDGVKRFGDGHLDHRLDIKTGDEIQQLAVQFNHMAGALKTLYSNLEEKVLEKTEELQKAYVRLQAQQDELKNAYEELKQIHERLRESEGKYSDIVENAYDMIMTTDAEGTITSVNHKLTQILGYTADELLGSRMEKIIPSSYAEMTKTALRQVLEKGSISDFETALQSKEGGTIRVEVNASGIQRDDKYVGMRAILRDIEQRKILEAQLLQSEKLSSVGQLASGVAHEINNPVGVISMFTQMLLETRKDQPDDPEIEKLQLIESQAEHIAKITKNLLEFARPKEFQIGQVDVNKSIENTLELVKPHLQKQKVELVMNLAEGLPEILGDGTQLNQVFINLTLNALHAMPEGGRLSISTAPAAVDSGAFENGGVEIRISDTGCGIPKEDLQRIFEPFFTTKKVGKGTGLGLSVTYNIVKNHKGSLLVESEEGHGSTFIIRLPVRF